MPRQTPAQKNLQRDRAVMRTEIFKLRSPDSDAAAKARAVDKITKTVLKTTGLAAADADTPQLVATLASALLDDGSVGLSGIEMAMQNAAIRLDIPKSEIDTLPGSVKQRLDRLV